MSPLQALVLHNLLLMCATTYILIASATVVAWCWRAWRAALPHVKPRA